MAVERVHQTRRGVHACTILQKAYIKQWDRFSTSPQPDVLRKNARKMRSFERNADVVRSNGQGGVSAFHGGIWVPDLQ